MTARYCFRRGGEAALGQPADIPDRDLRVADGGPGPEREIAVTDPDGHCLVIGASDGEQDLRRRCGLLARWPRP